MPDMPVVLPSRLILFVNGDRHAMEIVIDSAHFDAVFALLHNTKTTLYVTHSYPCPHDEPLTPLLTILPPTEKY